MDEIIIGFSTPKKWFSPFSWLIKWVEKTEYSHVYIKFYSNTYQRTLIYQASGTKVNFIGETRFNQDEIILAEFPIQVTDEQKQKIVQSAIDSIGVPYNVTEVFGIAYCMLVYKLIKKRIANPFANGKARDFCAKLVLCVLNEDLDSNINIDPSMVKPIDLYNYLVSKN